MSLRKIFFACLALLTFPHVSEAQVFRAYVSSAGNDANPCSLAAPCRLLPAALSAVASGGEIWMLDSANYNTGAVNINKSVTILAIPGALGSVVSVGAANAIDITTDSLQVTLRNLVVVPLPGSSGHGINMTVAGSLTVQGCNVANFASNLARRAIQVDAVNARLHVVDSVVRDSVTGILVANGASAIVAGSRILGHTDTGVYARTEIAGRTTSLSVSDSTLMNPNVSAYAFSTTTGATTRMSIVRSTISNSAYGVAVSNAAGGTVVVVAGDNMITGNGVAFYNGEGTIESTGNNIVRQNGPDFGIVTTVPMR